MEVFISFASLTHCVCVSANGQRTLGQNSRSDDRNEHAPYQVRYLISQGERLIRCS